jgi:hypothetical protein
MPTKALAHKAPEFPVTYVVYTRGVRAPFPRAFFDTWAEAARYIMKRGIRRIAWIVKV